MGKKRHSVQRQRLDRRTFLRGTLGGVTVTLALPALDIMMNDHGTALADGSARPGRFGVFFWGCGVIHDEWVPEQTGMTWDLPPALQGFADLREYVTQVTGANHRGSRPGHIPYRGLSLSSSHDPRYVDSSRAPGYRRQDHPQPTIDQIVADAWRGAAPLDWIGVGICRNGPYQSNSSWTSGGLEVEQEPNPARLWDTLFEGRSPTNERSPADERLFTVTTALRQSMLDALKDDATALQQRVGSRDRLRLEQHFDSLRDIERRLQARADMPTTSVCMHPPRPTRTNFGDGSAREEKEAKHEVMSELVATALACDLTRVFSYEWSATQSQTAYWELNLNGQHHEDYSHGNRGAMRRITRFIMDRYAELARKLRDLPEGDGNVLDNTLMVGTSEHADAAAHNATDHPYLMVGKSCGNIRAGLHYRAPRGNEDAPRVLLSAVRAAGVERDSLGEGEGRVATDPIADILT